MEWYPIIAITALVGAYVAVVAEGFRHLRRDDAERAKKEAAQAGSSSSRSTSA